MAKDLREQLNSLIMRTGLRANNWIQFGDSRHVNWAEEQLEQAILMLEGLVPEKPYTEDEQKMEQEIFGDANGMLHWTNGYNACRAELLRRISR